METAKLFYDGQSQVVLLPKEYHFSGNEVYIRKVGNAVMLFPKERAWETFLKGLDSFSDDFFADRRAQDVQAAERLLATECSRLLGTQGYTVDEFEKNMRKAIVNGAEYGAK